MNREEIEAYVMGHENLSDATDYLDIINCELEGDDRVNALYDLLKIFDRIKR